MSGRSPGASGPGRLSLGGGEAGTGSLGKSTGRIAFRPRGLTPRRRGDSARRVRWPEQGETEVRPPRLLVFGTAKSRKSPPPAPVALCTARSRPLACLGSTRRMSSTPDRPACAWPFRVGLPRQGTVTPGWRRSAAIEMRRTIAPLPVDHQHRHSQPTSAPKARIRTIDVSRPFLRPGRCDPAPGGRSSLYLGRPSDPLDRGARHPGRSIRPRCRHGPRVVQPARKALQTVASPTLYSRANAAIVSPAA